MLSRAAPPRATGGFTLLEVAVALAIIALVTGFIVTRMVGRTVDGEAAALSRNLSSVADGVIAFRNDVRRYPSQLSYLTAKPVAGLTTTDSCTNPIPARFLALWRGPYADRSISTSGVQSGTSTIRNAVTRQVLAADTVVRISVDGVDQGVADLVERSFEATASLSDGTIRWTDGGGGRGTLTYDLPVRGC